MDLYDPKISFDDNKVLFRQIWVCFHASHSTYSVDFLTSSVKMAPVLGYWNIRGITSSIRNLLHFAEAEFEEKLYGFSEEERKEWQDDKSTIDLAFPNLPYYIDGDVKLTQVIRMHDNTLN